MRPVHGLTGSRVHGPAAHCSLLTAHDHRLRQRGKAPRGSGMLDVPRLCLPHGCSRQRHGRSERLARNFIEGSPRPHVPLHGFGGVRSRLASSRSAPGLHAGTRHLLHMPSRNVDRQPAFARRLSAGRDGVQGRLRGVVPPLAAESGPQFGPPGSRRGRNVRWSRKAIRDAHPNSHATH